ncbi:type IV pilin [Natronococcus pandeyae]|uniref:Type IV pilin n=1 Tax=Natronococcus pandeyae TaxID=2055836 RepID=A0A8J8TPV2_9EURY|nr:type IV pilin N-terminal domain-containing protein [Natronococcus pandeyae]TYL38166.1 type IV pilin [Natronococcus pandeyae]
MKSIKNKLVGDKDERAVSPVIGVILMVAITVILAAVIAAFVLDMGDSISNEAQAGVEIDVTDTSTTQEVQVSVTSMGNSETIDIRGDWVGDESLSQSGDTVTFVWDNSSGEMADPHHDHNDWVDDNSDNWGDLIEDDEFSGTITAVGITDDEVETQIASEDFAFEDDS